MAAPKKQPFSTKSPKPPPRVRDEFGIGYVKPNSMPHSSLLKTIQYWQRKLAQSGFKDIETKSWTTPGRVTSHFQSDGSSIPSHAFIDQDAQDYYRLARQFYWDCDWQKHFPRRSRVMKFIWLGVSEGITYRTIARRLAGKRVSERVMTAMPRQRNEYQYRQARSLYWVHCRIHEIMPVFRQWRQLQAQLAD